MSILFYCTRGHSLSVSPALAGKKVRCPVCLDVVVAPHVAVPVKEESAAGDKEKVPLLPTDPTPVHGLYPPEGSALEIPDNPAIVPLGPQKSSVEEPDLEIPENYSLQPEETHRTLPVAEPIPHDPWHEVRAKKTPPPLPGESGKGPPPLPTAILELSGA